MGLLKNIFKGNSREKTAPAILCFGEKNMKRIVTLQDISCVGKCSLTVAIPILSALGVETCPIPTAVLSSHTAFSDFAFFDLTEQLPGITAALKKQKLHFDAIYTGYLGSPRQIQLVSNFIEVFKENGLVLVDPVMGDNGRLYSGFDESFPQAMACLCAKADIIVPNLTEAAFLLKETAVLNSERQEDIEKMMKRLARLGPKIVVLTGILRGEQMGAAVYNRDTGDVFTCFRPRIRKTFHGTGDIFASVLAGMLTRKFPVQKALETAVDFTYASMEKTLLDPDRRWYGVNFEEALPELIRMTEF